MVVVCIAVVLLENRNPARTAAWVLILTFLPFLGLFLYLIFGRSFHRQERISKKLRNKIYTVAKPQVASVSEASSAEGPNAAVIKKYAGLIRLLRTSGDAELFANNKVEMITDGKQLLESMIADIGTATNHIHVEYYIIENDDTGKAFQEALIKKAREGVEVRIIYDDLGSWHMKRSAVKKLKQEGVKLQSFFEIRFPYFTTKLNYRNHKKILVIDGRVGYVGGFNIADRYTKGLKWGYWRDTHMRFEGDGVAGLQSLFLTDWMYVTNKLHQTQRFFPRTDLRNDVYMQVVGSGPDMDYQTIMQGFCHAIHSAQKYIYIHNPYFLPNESIMNALQTAALSGIDVKIIIPYRSDARVVFEASLTYVSPLLDAGAEFYQYRRGFIHSKAIVIDDDLAIIGSANMDYRSFDQNFEDSAFVYDKAAAERARDIFQADLRKSRRITPETWKKRPWWRKLLESVARLLSPVM